MESLAEILKHRKLLVPDKLSDIKNYIHSKYKADSTIIVSKNSITIQVASPALAATLQLEKPAIIKACQLGNKRLIIRSR